MSEVGLGDLHPGAYWSARRWIADIYPTPGHVTSQRGEPLIQVSVPTAGGSVPCPSHPQLQQILANDELTGKASLRRDEFLGSGVAGHDVI
jgi:hypothetical protein